MKENAQDILTVEVFNKLLGEALATAFEQFRIDFGTELRTEIYGKIDALDRKMMSGFEKVFERFDQIDRRIDDVIITKTDKQDTLLIQKRILALEEKIA